MKRFIKIIYNLTNEIRKIKKKNMRIKIEKKIMQILKFYNNFIVKNLFQIEIIVLKTFYNANLKRFRNVIFLSHILQQKNNVEQYSYQFENENLQQKQINYNDNVVIDNQINDDIKIFFN